MDKMKILITGASGNVGKDLIRALAGMKSTHSLFAARRSISGEGQALLTEGVDEYRRLDFRDPDSYDDALKEVDTVFLLRPPDITSIKKVFVPFFDSMKRNGVHKIVFLSVQGAERQRFIPHAKIEKKILEYGFEYIFLRPGYFMQNITTTLFDEIQENDRIYMPAGRLKFNWIDTVDIGIFGATVLNEFDRFRGKAYELTGNDFTNFDELASLISRHTDRQIRYESPPILRFFRYKRQKGKPAALILVMLMLHYLPRLGKNPDRRTKTYESITGRQPRSLRMYIENEVSRKLNESN